jgi:hypothetical protein
MPVDRHGRPVTIGTRVKVLEIARSLKERVPPAEWKELQTMVGQVFAVYDIDEHGSPWVEKRWGNDSHHLALDSHEMEVVE